ncbi:MFS transporter [Methylobacterium oryzae CBMB20]
MAHRPDRAQEALLHHAGPLPLRHGGDRPVLERLGFCAFRFLTGAGIGGEYTAINSTIQELVPAGCAAGPTSSSTARSGSGPRSRSFMSIVLLKPEVIDPAWGWRVAFFTGGAIGLVILLLRTWIPESPRWLATHGYAAEADRVVTGIEKRFTDEGVRLPPVDESKRMKVRTRDHTPCPRCSRRCS